MRTQIAIDAYLLFLSLSREKAPVIEFASAVLTDFCVISENPFVHQIDKNYMGYFFITYVIVNKGPCVGYLVLKRFVLWLFRQGYLEKLPWNEPPRKRRLVLL